jgi:hypothetical protein
MTDHTAGEQWDGLDFPRDAGSRTLGGARVFLFTGQEPHILGNLQQRYVSPTSAKGASS